MANWPENRAGSYTPSDDDWGEPSYASRMHVPADEPLDDYEDTHTPPDIRPPNTTFYILAIIAGLIVFGLVIKAAMDRDEEYNKLRPEVEELDQKRGDYQ